MKERGKEQTLIIGLVLGATGCGCLLMAILIATAIFYSVFERARMKAQSANCLRNLRTVVLAISQYAADYDKTLPPASGWTDAVAPYLSDPRILICPAAKHLPCGYAFYEPVGGRTFATLREPALIPLLFDSSQGTRNYADKGQSVVLRHLEGAYIAFADTHIEWLPRQAVQLAFSQAPAILAGKGKGAPAGSGQRP